MGSEGEIGKICEDGKGVDIALSEDVQPWNQPTEAVEL